MREREREHYIHVNCIHSVLTIGPCIMMCLISSSCNEERKVSEGLTSNGTTDSNILTEYSTRYISS